MEGKYSISWEKLTTLEFGTTHCAGCTDFFYIGEIHAKLYLNKTSLHLHESCLEQLEMFLNAFIEATKDTVNEVKERQN